MQHTIQLEAVATARLLGSSWLATGPQNTNTTVSGINAGETAVNRAFIRFGDFEIPSYANIVSATLQVYVSARSSSSGYTHYIFPITDNGNLWTPQSRNGATWSTAARSTIYLSRDERWVSTSIVDIANAWKDGTADPERGICIFSEVAGSWKQFDGALRANKPRLTIVYDVPASVPVPDKSSVALGGSLTTDLIANEAGASHVIAYKIGETTLASYNIGTATSHTYTIPTSAGANFPNALTAALTVEVTTTVDGESRGSVTHEVTLTLPEDAAPTASCSIARTWAEGVSSAAQLGAFVQSRSGATFDLTGTAKYGATVVSWQLGIDNRVYTASGASASIAHAPIAGSGEVPYTCTVTDSRGLTRSYTGTLMVLAWTAPQITAFSIQRVNSSGAQAVDGTCALASVQGSVASLMVDGAEKNSLRYRVQYRQTGTEAWTDSDEVATTAVSVDQSWVLQADGEDIDSFNDMQGYQFRLMLADIYAASQAMDEMPTKEIRLSIHEESGNMGFGGEARTDTDGPHYDFYGPVHFRAGSTGQTVYSAEELDTGSIWIDGRPIYRVCGMQARAMAASTFTDIEIGVAAIENVICADVYLRQGAAWRPANYPNRNTLSVHTWLINNSDTAPSLRIIMGNDMSADAVSYAIEYTKAEDTPTYYWLPFLSSPNEEGCVLTASSEYSSGYQVEYAFNGLTSNYWACTNNDSQRWVQVQMPYALRNITVKLVSPQGSAVQTANVPVSGSFQGSNDGSSWAALGSYSGRSTAAGSVTTHSLNNSTGYKYLRISITSPGASSGVWTGFGDIRIEGEVVS